ncbi:MAG: HD domain-containing protein [Phycisphaerales bacterium]
MRRVWGPAHTMLMCGINDVPAGAVLGSIVTDPRNPSHDLLRPGVTLDPPIVASLRSRGVTQVWIQDTLTADLDAAVAPGLTAAKLEVYGKLRDGLATCAKGTMSSSSLASYRGAVLSMVTEAISSEKYAAMTDALFSADGLASHGANVAYLSLLCGLHIEQYVVAEQSKLGPKEAREMGPLGLAGLLHDIGKTRLRPVGQRYHDQLAPESGGGSARPEGYIDHVRIGRMLLEHCGAPARVGYTVLNHHQRFDGCGWPDLAAFTAGRIKGKLAGRRIHIYARIVAAANVLDGLMRDAEGRKRPPVAALGEFASSRFEGWFDPIVRRALLLRVPPFAIGVDVRLNDGRRGVVIGLNEHDPCRPVVRIINPLPPTPPGGVVEPETVELETNPALRITHSLGEEVEKYLYEVPRADSRVPAGVSAPEEDGSDWRE